MSERVSGNSAVASALAPPSAGQAPEWAVLIVTEWMAGGDLLRLLLGDVELSWVQRVRLLSGASSGLAHLHGRGVIHRGEDPGVRLALAAPVRHAPR